MSAAKRAGRQSMAASLGRDAPAYPITRFAAFPNSLARSVRPQIGQSRAKEWEEGIRKKAEEIQKVTVRIAFFGQPGVGKSSLINAIVGEEIAYVSNETDVTKELKPYPYKGLELCDLPGYGTKEFPARTYFERFRISDFDLVIWVSAGKFHENDAEFHRDLYTFLTHPPRARIFRAWVGGEHVAALRYT